MWFILALIDRFGLSLHFQDILGEASSLLQSWKRWDSPEDETVQYYFIGKAYFIVENCGRALKMNLYNTSLSGKLIFQSRKLYESPEDATIQHFLIGFPANFGEDEGGDTVVQ